MIYKLQPIFFDKIWGGSKIKLNYDYDCLNKKGGAWGIRASKNGSSIVLNGEIEGKTLRELFSTNKELFGNYPGEEFPILIKIIDATDDLSIQVHPNDSYARLHENSLGKTECWYILDAEKNTDIIIGHKADNLEEFKNYFDSSNFESILNKFKIKKGDLFNIYAGTIHAICKGTLLLEIQQSSDVTYRLYDYNRLSNGLPRDLHVDKAFDVITFPDRKLAKDKPTNLFDFDTYTNKEETHYKADQYGY